MSQQLPPIVKTVGTLAGIGAGIYFGRKLYKKIFPTGTEKADKEEKNANTETVTESKKYLDNLTKLKKPTYSDAIFKGWADVLYTAMDGVGTDFGAIVNVIKYMRSDTDVVKLVVTFGVRNKKTNNPFSSSSQALNLRAWFADELSNIEIGGLNKILAANKIAYRF